MAALRKPDRLLFGEGAAVAGAGAVAAAAAGAGARGRLALCFKLWTTSKVFISQENDFENRRSRKRVCEIKE